MPDLSAQSDALIGWLSTNGVALAIVAIVALLAYRWARPVLHRLIVSLVHRQAALTDDAARLIEIDKRASTVEDVIAKALKALVVVAVAVVVIGILELWPLLAGLGLVAAAITLAGQDVVLDYLMGILILVEGQYYKGDIVRIGGIEGTVEEVGLRRTVIRDVRGTLHSISNGEIRTSANRTRSYAIASIAVDGIADADVERMIVLLDSVGADLAADPDLAEALIDTPGYRSTSALSALGATLLMSCRVQPEHRVRVEAEMRRRVAAEMAAAGVVPIRPAAGRAPDPSRPAGLG